MPQSTTTPPSSAPPPGLPPPEHPEWLEWYLNSPFHQFLSDYFRDPLGAITRAASAALDTALRLADRYASLLLAGLLLLIALQVWAAVLQNYRRSRGACWVEIHCPPEVTMHGARQLWTALHDALLPRWHAALTGSPHLSWELHWSPDGRLRFGLWVPGSIPAAVVQHAIEGAWPGTRTQRHTPPPPPIPLEGRCTGGVLKPAFAEWYALEFEQPTDPLRALVAAAGELHPGEHACIQVLAGPVTPRRLRRTEHVAMQLRTGVGRPSRSSPWTLPVRLLRGLFGVLFELLGLFLPGLGGGLPARPTPASRDPARGQDVSLILAKLARRPHWEARIRYVVATTAPTSLLTRAGWQARGRLRTRARALAAAFGVFTGRNSLRPHRLPRPAAALAARQMPTGSLVCLPELAALAHLPVDDILPGVTRAGAKVISPAPEIPARGKILGDSQASPTRPIALAVPDSRHHLHVMGATGTGKSTLLANLVVGEVEAGRGCVLLDPNGDLARNLLDRLPRLPDPLVIIDPEDTAAPPSLNILDGPNPELTVEHLVGICRRLFASHWGPRIEDLLRTGCLTLLHPTTTGEPAPAPPTLADLPALLTDPAVRARHVARLPSDSPLRGYWATYDQLGPGQQATTLAPLLARLRAFLLRPLVRDTIGNAASSFDLANVLDGGLLLVRLPKGILGEDATRLLGSLLVARTWQAAMYRAGSGPHARPDATLIIDEAHNFLTLPIGFETIAAEARGYRLSLVLAHQHLAQLSTELQHAIGANARNKLWLSMSPDDARALARHVLPALTEHDLANLGAWQAAARLVVAGKEAPACTLAARPMPTIIPGRAEELRAHARATTGRSRTQRQDDKPTSDLAGRRGIRPEALRLPGRSRGRSWERR